MINKMHTWVATEDIFALPSTATTLDAPAFAAKRLQEESISNSPRGIDKSVHTQSIDLPTSLAFQLI
jgi:hypothetical protein